MNYTKKQHYVPQFYLKYFCINEDKINVYLKKENKILKNQLIRNVACENDYFDEKGNCNCELIVMDRILLQELVDKTTWVPVKKGLPDDRQVVLTIKNKHISILEYHADTKHWFETRGNWWWSYNMVDAWMPLPKPYLGSER